MSSLSHDSLLYTDFDVQVFTVASDETEGYVRYIRSANYYDVEVTTLGLHDEWRGGKMDSYGGGYKINLLRQALEPLGDDDKKIVLFTDRYLGHSTSLPHAFR